MNYRRQDWIILTVQPDAEQCVNIPFWNYEVAPNNFIKKGHSVYLWSNINHCFFAWGEVAESPRIIEHSATQLLPSYRRMELRIERRKFFEPPLYEKNMLLFPSLKKLIPNGYDDLYAISIRPGQANIINDYVRLYGGDAPIGSESLEIVYEKIIPNIDMKGILKVKDKTQEGQLIQAVMYPWFDIIEKILENPEYAFEIPPRVWEEIVAGGYRKAGFDEVILTPHSGDYGRDVIAIKKGIGEIRVIDQVKAYKPGHLVNANDVRALMGILHTDGASKAFLSTTSDFAPGIWTDPLIQPLLNKQLELTNGEKLIKRLMHLRLS